MNDGMGILFIGASTGYMLLSEDALIGLTISCDLAFLQTWKFSGLSLLYS